MTGLEIRIVERALQFKSQAGTVPGRAHRRSPSFYVIAGTSKKMVESALENAA